MAVYDQWHRDPRPGDEPCKCGTARRPLYPSSRHGQGDRWQVRYRDPDGRQCKKGFAKRVGANPGEHADAFDKLIAEQLRTRNYTDPAAAEVTLRAYAEEWRAGRGHDVNRAAVVEGHLRNHVYPDPRHPERTPRGGVPVGQHPLGLLARRPSLTQAWIQSMPLAPSSRRQVTAIVSAIFRAAMDDGIIGRDPVKAASVDRPSPGAVKARPWTREKLAAMRDALPGWCAIVPDLGAGTGMRQGEMLGLAAEDIQFLGRRPHVSVTRQVKVVGGKLHFGPLKNRKPHSVPLSPVLAGRLAAHMAAYPPVAVTLPWHDPRDKGRHGQPVTVRLVLTTPAGKPVQRNDFDEHVWRRALLRAGIIASVRGPARQDGCHALRHTFASVQLRARVDIVRVAAWLGDTPQTVARVYAHLLPGDDDGDGRAAVDEFLSGPPGESARESALAEGAHT